MKYLILFFIKREMEKNKGKFHGLSSPQELIEMWRELRYDDDDDDINVIWDYMEPDDLQPGFNIVNIKYNPKAPTETGHYVLISVLPKDKPKEIEYFNPVAAHTKDDEDKLNDILNFAEEHDLESNVDLSGKQTETSENCGFHCLTHAYNLYKRMESDSKNKKDSQEEDSKEGGAPKLKSNQSEDKMDVLIKAVRGIYYGLKYGFDKPTAPRKNKGSGLKPSYECSGLKPSYECSGLKPSYECSGLKPSYECSGLDVSRIPRHLYRNLKASGLADYGKDEYNFTELRREIEEGEA
jgi:hypothetical protein